MLVAITGWTVMAWMVYLMLVTARSIPKIWDPYEVLGVSRSADEKAIKSHYRRLSLTEHPDKVRIDPAKNMTKESVDEHWVEITKAFKALTDEEVRNNFLQYGHPDGKQSFSIGIALPKLIVEDGNGKYVLMMYGLFLGIILPYVVGSWWYGTQKLTKDKVLVSSAGNLFREYSETIDEGGVIGVLSSGDEYKETLGGQEAERGMASIEKRVLSEGADAPTVKEMTLKDREKLRDMDEGVRRKVLGLLWAYLARIDFADSKLDDEKVESAPIAHSLVESFISICLAYGNTQPLLAAYRTSQDLIQALLPNSSPLLQLPYVTPKVVRAIEGETARSHISVQDFMALPAEDRKRRATGDGLLTQRQYQSAMALASKLPLVKVEKAFFRVTGEKVIVPNSLVQFVVKARIIPPGAKDLPALSEQDLEDKAGLEEEEKEDPEVAAKKRIQPPVAHAPYFARDHSPR
ncbi:MAG: DnaJ domain-containing protein, partial [Terriglobus roseus]|nr:DnaJ domain-containing protein [Terriglobus roseus]